MLKINEAIKVKVLLLDSNYAPTTGTITYVVYDEADASFATGSMNAVSGVTGFYTMTFTPDAAGEWTVKLSCANPVRSVTKFFLVGKGVEQDIYDIIKSGGAGDLAAIKTETDKISTLLTESQSHPTLAEIEATSVLAKEATLGTHDTDIKALLATVQADLDAPNQYKADVSALALEATLGTHDADIKALLEHATYGLSQLRTEIDANETKIDTLTTNLGTHDTALGTHDTDMKADFDRHLTHVDFWSEGQVTVNIPDTADSDINLPDVIVPALPTGATIWKVFLLFKCAIIKDTTSPHADNAIDEAGVIRIKKDGDATFDGNGVDAYVIEDNKWSVDVSEATERGGDAFVGKTDLGPNGENKVDGADTYELRLDSVSADGANLVLVDVCVGLRVYFY